MYCVVVWVIPLVGIAKMTMIPWSRLADGESSEWNATPDCAVCMKEPRCILPAKTQKRGVGQFLSRNKENFQLSRHVAFASRIYNQRMFVKILTCALFHWNAVLCSGLMQVGLVTSREVSKVARAIKVGGRLSLLQLRATLILLSLFSGPSSLLSSNFFPISYHVEIVLVSNAAEKITHFNLSRLHPQWFLYPFSSIYVWSTAEIW